jgi:hypothetical protein
LFSDRREQVGFKSATDKTSQGQRRQGVSQIREAVEQRRRRRRTSGGEGGSRKKAEVFRNEQQHSDRKRKRVFAEGEERTLPAGSSRRDRDQEGRAEGQLVQELRHLGREGQQGPGVSLIKLFFLGTNKGWQETNLSNICNISINICKSR